MTRAMEIGHAGGRRHLRTIPTGCRTDSIEGANSILIS